MNSIPNEVLYSARELVQIIKACGEAGVTEFPMNGGVMKLTPRWVSEEHVAIAQTAEPEQITLPLFEDDPITMAIENPLAWQRAGMNPEDTNDET